MRDSSVYAGGKRTIDGVPVPPDPVLFWGVEVETCMPTAPKLVHQDGGVSDAPDFAGFNKDEDGSIRCDTGYVAVEYVLAEPVEYVQNEMLDVLATLKHILERGKACARMSCGTHIHVSLRDVTVQSDPFLLLVLQKKWIARFEEFQTKFKLRDTFYTRRNEKVWGRGDLEEPNNKYYNLNLRPTFYKKESKGRYNDIAPPYRYHVEFRGMGDFLQTFASSESQTFAEKEFREYLHTMAEFLRDCVKDTEEVKRIVDAPLSNLELDTIGPKMTRQLQSAQALARLDLSENLLGDQAYRTLFAALENCEALTSLDMRNQRTLVPLSAETVATMVAYMKRTKPRLKELLLAGNRMPDQSFKDLTADPPVVLERVREWTVHTESLADERRKRLKIASIPHTYSFAFVVFNREVFDKLKTSKDVTAFQLGDQWLSFPYVADSDQPTVWNSQRICELMEWLRGQTCPDLKFLTLGVKQLPPRLSQPTLYTPTCVVKAIKRHASTLQCLVFELPTGVFLETRIPCIIANECLALTSLNGYSLDRTHHSVSPDRRNYCVFDATALLSFFRLPEVKTIDLQQWQISDHYTASLCIIPDTLTRLTGVVLKTQAASNGFLDAQRNTCRTRVTVCRVFEHGGFFLPQEDPFWEGLFALFPHATFTQTLQADVVTLPTLPDRPYPEKLLLRELAMNENLSVFEMHVQRVACSLQQIADVLQTKRRLFEVSLIGLNGTEHVDAAIRCAEVVKQSAPNNAVSVKQIVVSGTWDDAAHARLEVAVEGTSHQITRV